MTNRLLEIWEKLRVKLFSLFYCFTLRVFIKTHQSYFFALYDKTFLRILFGYFSEFPFYWSRNNFNSKSVKRKLSYFSSTNFWKKCTCREIRSVLVRDRVDVFFVSPAINSKFHIPSIILNRNIKNLWNPFKKFNIFFAIQYTTNITTTMISWFCELKYIYKININTATRWRI